LLSSVHCKNTEAVFLSLDENLELFEVLKNCTYSIFSQNTARKTPYTMAVQTDMEYHIFNNTVLSDSWRYHPCTGIHTSNLQTEKARSFSPNKGKKETP